MINLEGDQNTRQDSREERIQSAMYISPRKNSVVPSRIEKSFSPAVYIFHAIFQNPSLLSLTADVHSLIHSWTNREDSRIPRTPQSGDPRSSAPATRIQIRKLLLSRSILRAPFSLFLQLTREERRAGSTTKEKRNRVMYVPRYTMYVGSGREHRRSLQY